MGGPSANSSALLLSILTGLVALTGCVVRVPVHDTKVPDQVPVQSGAIVPGESDRASVRASLGEPWLASTYWAFDLFRKTGRSTSVPVMFVFWWPVPMGVAVDETTVYTLVAYDVMDRVTASSFGSAHDPSIYDEGGSLGTPTVARISAGDLQFATAQGEQDATLTVVAARRDQFLREHPPYSTCRVLLGCTGADSYAAVSIDGGGSIAIPNDRCASAVVPLPRVNPGTHRIKVSSLRPLVNFHAEADFSCEAGTTLYGLLDFQFVKWNMLSAEWKATLTLSGDLATPEAFVDRPLVIWLSGDWMVPQEPTAPSLPLSGPTRANDRRTSEGLAEALR